ncbi:flagella basal body P-ring formation protein FlgA [Shewanella sp. NFH-SH190041]|nr:flagella basal body P-ring formation protein FlgA [Shewanella sp. NFH-SH190041]
MNMKLISLLAFYLSIFSTNAAQNTHLTANNTLYKLAKSTVAAKLNAADGAKVRLHVTPFQPGNTPPGCEGKLEASLATNRAIKQTNTVKIRCRNQQNRILWQRFLPVRVDILLPVVVAARQLTDGEYLTEKDVSQSWLPQTQLRGGQFAHISEVIGTKTTRRTAQGHPLYQDNLCFICKGDAVAIYARSGQLTIKTQGIALNNGRIGEQIEIKNMSSNKKITATITAIGIVEVGM